MAIISHPKTILPYLRPVKYHNFNATAMWKWQLDSRHSGCTAQRRPGQRHHVDTAIQHDVHEAMAHRHLQRSGQAPQHADVLAANGQHPLTASRLALTG